MSINNLFNDSENFICNLCEKSFVSLKALKSHRPWHNPEHIIKCVSLEKSKKSTETRKRNLSLKKDKEKFNYNLAPKKCNICNEEISFERRNNIFCSSSCGAISSNKSRTKESREKQRKSILTYYNVEFYPFIKKEKSKTHILKDAIKVSFPSCEVCDSLFCSKGWSRNRKTCSYECAETLKSLKSIRTKRYSYKGIQMQSVWEIELAKFLDGLNIKWIRPKHVKWIDKDNKIRKYFPDFYLEDFGIYLDPKNPYVQKLDDYKIRQVKKEINVFVGILDECKKFIINLNNNH